MEQMMNAENVPKRRFPAPWRVDRIEGGFVVKDANGFRLAYIYSPPNHADLGTAAVDHLSEDEARRIAAGIARLPELLAKGRDG
jgi:hypothetical protein